MVKAKLQRGGEEAMTISAGRTAQEEMSESEWNWMAGCGQ